ncbi:MAG: hypothetical protein ACK4K2_08365 [Dehalococcoidia bacterium]
MSRWLLIGIGLGIVALIVVALVATFALQRRGQPLYPLHTPEGVTQRYLQALAEERLDEAYGYLAPDLQAHCPQDKWEGQVAHARLTLEQSAVFLRGVTYRDEGVAVVRVAFSQQAPPRPFNLAPGEYSGEQEFRLKRQEDGAWRFTAFPWPLWPETRCV